MVKNNFYSNDSQKNFIGLEMINPRSNNIGRINLEEIFRKRKREANSAQFNQNNNFRVTSTGISYKPLSVFGKEDKGYTQTEKKKDQPPYKAEVIEMPNKFESEMRKAEANYSSSRFNQEFWGSYRNIGLVNNSPYTSITRAPLDLNYGQVTTGNTIRNLNTPGYGQTGTRGYGAVSQTSIPGYVSPSNTNSGTSSVNIVSSANFSGRLSATLNSSYSSASGSKSISAKK